MNGSKTDGALALEVVDEPGRELLELLSDSLFEHNSRVTGTRDFRWFAVVLRDASGDVVGGSTGWTRWGWLHLDVLWIDDARRGEGHGRRLLRETENVASARGCSLVTLETASFQAPGFYRCHGYEEMFAHDVPEHGIRKHFFRKVLVPVEADRESR